MKNKFICCLLVLALQSASVVFGQGTFNAIASGSWNTPANWSLTGGVDADGIPDADDTATIPAGITIDMAGGTIYQIATLIILNAGTLDMNNANAVLDIVPSGGLLQVDVGGVISNPVIDDGNEINFLANSSFAIDGTVQTDLLDFEGLNQTVNITGAGTLTVGSFGVSNSGITINLNTTGSFGSNLYQLDVDMPNFTINGTGLISLTGDGDLVLSASGLSIGCNIYLSEDIEIIASSSSLAVTSGGNVTVQDDVRVGPANDARNSIITIDNGGTLTIRDDLNFNNEGTGATDGSSVTNSGTVEIGELIEVNNETSITITNNSLFTIYGNILFVAAASSVSFTNTANATFITEGTIDNDLVVDFTATGNTVNYRRSDGLSQPIRPTTYYHLTLLGAGAKTAGGDITLLGNWTNSGVTFTPGTNTVTFAALAGTAAQTISAVGGETFYNLTINSALATSPQIILNNPVTVSNVLTMTAGNINLNGNSFAITSTSTGALVHSQTSVSGWMYGGSIIRTRPSSSGILISLANARSLFPLGTATDWRPFFVGQNNNAGTGGTMTVSHNNTNSTTSDVVFPEGITRRHNNFWTVSTTTISAGTFTLQAGGTTWGTIEPGAAGLLDIRMSTSTGVVGTHAASTGGPDYRVNRTGVAFADLANNYHMASIDATFSPLPIELVSFSGEAGQDAVHLHWKTASELNNDYFTVERSAGGEIFSSIGRIRGNGTTSNSNTYSLLDQNPISGIAYYRLKQTDFNGTFTYSKVIDVTYEGSTLAEMEVFPNPSKGGEFNIKIKGLKNVESLPVVMYDQLGRECARILLSVDQNSGIAFKTFLPEKILPQGVYLLKAGPTPQLTKRFIVNSK